MPGTAHLRNLRDVPVMNLIIGCCGSDPGLVLTNHLEAEQVLDVQVRGVVCEGGRIYFCAGLGLYEYHSPGEFTQLWTDGNGEWHGLTHHEGRLYMVHPRSDDIWQFDMDGKHLDIIHYKTVVERQHTNDICFHKGVMYQSNFQQGICKEGVPLGLGAGDQPHSVTFWNDRLVFCASAKSQVVLDGEVLATYKNFFVRGLLSSGDRLWVGRGRTRRGFDRRRADVVCIDDKANIDHTINLTCGETYDICQHD